MVALVGTAAAARAAPPKPSPQPLWHAYPLNQEGSRTGGARSGQTTTNANAAGGTHSTSSSGGGWDVVLYVLASVLGGVLVLAFVLSSLPRRAYGAIANGQWRRREAAAPSAASTGRLSFAWRERRRLFRRVRELVRWASTAVRRAARPAPRSAVEATPTLETREPVLRTSVLERVAVAVAAPPRGSERGPADERLRGDADASGATKTIPALLDVLAQSRSRKTGDGSGAEHPAPQPHVTVKALPKVGSDKLGLEVLKAKQKRATSGLSAAKTVEDLRAKLAPEASSAAEPENPMAKLTKPKALASTTESKQSGSDGPASEVGTRSVGIAAALAIPKVPRAWSGRRLTWLRHAMSTVIADVRDRPATLLDSAWPYAAAVLLAVMVGIFIALLVGRP